MKHIIIKTYIILLWTGISMLTIQAQKPKWIIGEWEGQGIQPDSQSQVWDIRLKADEKSKSFEVFYPSLDCGGNWVLKKSEKNKAVFIEKLNSGLSNCINNGKVIVTMGDKNYLNVLYYSSWESDNAIAFGILIRK